MAKVELRSWTYADLTARLKTKLGSTAPNPLFSLVQRHRPNLDESRFVDTVSGCLTRGDFDLIVAGDGIRSDMHAIAGFLGAAGGLIARFALVEFQVWHGADDTTVVLPFIPFHTRVVEQRVLVGADGRPLSLETSAEDREDVTTVVDPDRAAKLAENRAFWDRLIETIRFTHPDQSAPRHGGNNWVRAELPCGRMVLYRTGREVGAFVTFKGADAEEILTRFEADRLALEEEIEQQLGFVREPGGRRYMIAKQAILRRGIMTEEDQLEWLRRIGDRMVTAVRTRI
jgi:hypothetical protein